MKRQQTTLRGAQGGYVALMTTIIISLVLLALVAGRASEGSNVRAGVLGTEAKEQAYALAEGCAAVAKTLLATDPGFSGGDTYALPGGSCRVVRVIRNAPAPGMITLHTQAEVRGSYSNLEVVLYANLTVNTYREVAKWR